eukprot:GHRR01031366.1.p2 GENE.GHRR01031366.1~~GHRR01031366.1.p2  ORF type:complete len:130 (+),score=18.29 GHRR01031366.1:957-1346(+)
MLLTIGFLRMSIIQLVTASNAACSSSSSIMLARLVGTVSINYVLCAMYNNFSDITTDVQPCYPMVQCNAANCSAPWDTSVMVPKRIIACVTCPSNNLPLAARCRRCVYATESSHGAWCMVRTVLRMQKL